MFFEVCGRIKTERLGAFVARRFVFSVLHLARGSGDWLGP